MLISTATFATNSNFPSGPNLEMTPGKLCDKPTSFRYPQQIPYCDRDVTSSTKMALIKQYDDQLGFHIESMDRSEFKIDHFIPLCAGGSNDSANLWPQHKSIYEITDPVEPLICDKMAAGLLKQADAVLLVTRAKTHLDEVNDVMDILNKL